MATSYTTRAKIRTIRTIAARTFYTLFALLFICFYAPLFSLMGAVLAHFALGITDAQGYAMIDAGCQFARDTIGYAMLCGTGA